MTDFIEVETFVYVGMSSDQPFKVGCSSLVIQRVFSPTVIILGILTPYSSIDKFAIRHLSWFVCILPQIMLKFKGYKFLLPGERIQIGCK